MGGVSMHWRALKLAVREERVFLAFALGWLAGVIYGSVLVRLFV